MNVFFIFLIIVSTPVYSAGCVFRCDGVYNYPLTFSDESYMSIIFE